MWFGGHNAWVGPLTKHVVLKLSDEFYEELRKRAEEEGYSLITDYILEVLSRELERAPFNPRALEARIERLEKGELPPPLQEAIWKLIDEALNSKLSSLAVEGGEINVSINEKELVNKVVEMAIKKLERKIMDMINPWSQKVDALYRQLGELAERLEAIEEKVGKEEKKEEVRGSHKELHVERAYSSERKRTKKSAMDILRERKVNFEEDMSFARNVDKLIEKLRKSGAIVIETTKHGRIVVHPEAWEEFWERLKEAGSSEEEVREALMDERLFRLFEALREDGLIYYNAAEGWTPSPDLRKLIEERVPEW